MAALRTIIALICLFSLSSPAYGGKKSVVATFLPIWVFAKNVAGERAGVFLLVPPDTDVHEFTLRPRDLKRLEGADLVVINGAGLEESFIKLKGTGRRILDTSQGIALIGRPGAYNPHLWLDPLLAAEQVRGIGDALALIDPQNREYYLRNAKEYIGRLEALHLEIKAGLESLKGKDLITFHESFNYFARRYGLRAYSLTGPNAEQPLPKRLKEVYDIVRDKGVRAVFAEMQFPAAALMRLKFDLGVEVCVLNTLESGKPLPGYYEEAMRENLSTILRCLGGRPQRDSFPPPSS